MSSAVVEVVLGLVFVFFLFSMLCSGINEMISRLMGKRADFLTLGVWRLLEHSGTDDEERARYFTRFWQHPLVRTLGQPAPDKADRPDQAGPPQAWVRAWTGLCAWTRRRLTTRQMKVTMRTMPYEPRTLEGGRLRPSYIPGETFATVVTDLLREDQAGPARPVRMEDAGAGDAPEAPAESPLARAVNALAAETGDEAQRLRASLERWYDAQMERVSGWYKRESKRMLLWLGILVVLALNVDTIAIARTLWNDPSTRRALVAAADRELATAASTTVAPSAATPPATTVQSLPLPIGWRVPDACGEQSSKRSCDVGDRVRDAWDGVRDAGVDGSLLKLVGWGLTIGALTFGAPFWFDLLNRFGSLRGSGAKPKSAGET
jgi:hypothetical protein